MRLVSRIFTRKTRPCAFAEWVGFTCFLLVIGTFQPCLSQTAREVMWNTKTTIADPPVLPETVANARKTNPRNFGADYPRALELKDGTWLCVYTAFEPGNNGYLTDPKGGARLFVAKSIDNGENWHQIAMLSDPGRDLDNGELIQLAHGGVLLASRSVRWQESYRLLVFRSTNNGETWKYLSTIDANEGKPGELGHPDKGVYEPHFYQIDAEKLGVMYSTEKHVLAQPSYSQTVAEKISTNEGATWSEEIRVAADAPEDRPGMPVWTRMKDGKYIVTYENCGPRHCQVQSKISEDGIHWPAESGKDILMEIGAPYVLGMEDRRLILTANNSAVSMSDDYGKSWHPVAPAFDGTPDIAYFSSIYQVHANQIMLLTGLRRAQGGRKIVAQFGTIKPR